MLRCAATHCNTLQYTATSCNTLLTGNFFTLQHAASHCNTLQRFAMHFNTLQHSATHCNTLQHIEEAVSRQAAVIRDFFPCVQFYSTHCSTRQHTATQCNTLQHTATHRKNCLSTGSYHPRFVRVRSCMRWCCNSMCAPSPPCVVRRATPRSLHVCVYVCVCVSD